MRLLDEYLQTIPAARALLALATLVALAGSGPARGAPAASAAAPPAGKPARAGAVYAEMEHIAGTVKTVDLRGGTLDLVTGVGLSLRMRRVHLPAQLKVKGAAPESAAMALTPGCIVRVGCHRTRTGMVASTVELLRAAPREMKP